MSQYSKNAPRTTPKTERWLLIMALAFVPVIVALFVPEAARIPLLAVSGLTFATHFGLPTQRSCSKDKSACVMRSTADSSSQWVSSVRGSDANSR